MKFILILWLSGSVTSHPYADYHGGLVAQPMQSKESCIYALTELRKLNAGVNGYCVPN